MNSEGDGDPSGEYAYSVIWPNGTTAISGGVLTYTPGDIVVEQADCSTITTGFCVDTDNGNLYYWDGDSVEPISAAVTELSDDTTPVLGGNLDISTFNIEGVDATEFGYLDGVTAFAATILDDGDAATVRTTIGALATDGVGTSLTALNGENIQDDTIDDDSIDFSDVTGADLTLTDVTDITLSGNLTVDAVQWNTTSYIDGEAVGDDTIDDDSIDFTDVTLADITFDVGSVDTTEFGYLNGVTSAIQTQFDGKQALHAYLTDIAGITAAQGDVVYFDGTDFTNLGPGTDGYFLKTQGAGANPTWAAPPGGGDITAVGGCANGDCYTDGGNASLTLTFEGTDNAYETVITVTDPAADATVNLANESGTFVIGPAGFGTDNILVKTNGTGQLTQATGISVDDSNNMSSIGTIGSGAITSSGAVTGSSVTDGTVTLAGDGTITGVSAGGLPDNIVDNGTMADDAITVDEMGDSDHGDVAWSSGNATVEAVSGANSIDSDAYVDGSVDPVHLADADFGDFTVSSGSATLDADVVAAAEMADADHGMVSWSSGSATVEDFTLNADASVPDDIAIVYGTGSDWDSAYDEAGDDRLEFVHAAGAGADVYWDLNDNAADSTYTITNSDGTYEANLSVEGDFTIGGAMTVTGDGDSYITLTNNTSYAGSGYQIFFEGGDLISVEGGSEKTLLNDADGATLTGTSWDFGGVTNFEIPNGASAAADAEGEVAVDTDDDQFQVYVGGVAIKMDFTDDASGYILKSNGAGVLTMQADATGGSPTIDTVGNAAGDATITFDAGEEMSWQYTGAYTTGPQFLIQQQTGNPTGGTLFEVRGADSDSGVFEVGDGTNVWTVSTAGLLANAGTATLNFAAASDILVGGVQIDHDDMLGAAVVTSTGGLNIDEDVDIDFNASDEEMVITNSAEYGAGGFQVTIDNADADVGAQMYLLNLDYSADDGQANADYVIAQDSGGEVFRLGQDGDVTTTDGDYTTTNGTVSAEHLTSTDDIYLDSDSAVLAFGDDQKVPLTYVVDTGLQMELDDSIMFGDTAVFIESDDDGYLDLDADTGIRLNGDVTASGSLVAKPDLLTDTSGAITITVNAVNYGTDTGDADIPDGACDAAGDVGNWVVLISSAADQYSLTSDDASNIFILDDLTNLDAGDELDVDGSMVCVMCIAAEYWKVTGYIDTAPTDGGAAD